MALIIGFIAGLTCGVLLGLLCDYTDITDRTDSKDESDFDL